MSAPFRTTRRVEFADTDMAGIVHFANFFRYMEAAEVDFLRSLGLSVAMEWEGRRVGLPRVAASCDFLRPAFFQDVLTIDVRIRRLGTKSITYAFEFSKEGEVIARGQLSCVCCLVGAGQRIESVAIPAAMREKLKQVAGGNPDSENGSAD